MLKILLMLLSYVMNFLNLNKIESWLFEFEFEWNPIYADI